TVRVCFVAALGFFLVAAAAAVVIFFGQFAGRRPVALPWRQRPWVPWGEGVCARGEDCSRAAEELKNNPRHKPFLGGVSLQQLQKLYQLLRNSLSGLSLDRSLEIIHKENTIDPEEDLNKLDDKELDQKKKIMDELFEKNRKKSDDPDFVYDVEVDFAQVEPIESCGWDDEETNEDF
uniref:Centrosomal protein of 19 kDa n=2 Tax=Callorhinchus milii TaxID=7868 RepID=A0A4W3J400_CALMI